ncbi:exported hypothetical protein [Candidatus Terasakiella magnetica]|uniref:Uncharacterized protein n=1 Tax=Candidatus Terasakiella magnetica TaxID=1867952 RepID=A0A1C3RIX0_9PROT|nr:hypothetical protein [Candidatus Terasakiella magnetica]SCA57207.1 exported hypothetical protein [Candidatus Terasakiella magnetica]
MKLRTPSHSLSLGMKVGFLLGWVFFAAAFLLAAAEAVVSRGFITSTNDLLIALAPGKWIAFKARFDSVLLDVILSTILQLPGWFVAGFPAFFLIWTCRPHREEMDPELYNSLTTFDRLAKLAEEDGAQNDDPTFQEYHLEDYEEDYHREDVKSATDYMKEWQPEAVEEEDQTPKGPNERMDDARAKLTIPFDKLS